MKCQAYVGLHCISVIVFFELVKWWCVSNAGWVADAFALFWGLVQQYSTISETNISPHLSFQGPEVLLQSILSDRRQAGRGSEREGVWGRWRWWKYCANFHSFYVIHYLTFSFSFCISSEIFSPDILGVTECWSLSLQVEYQRKKGFSFLTQSDFRILGVCVCVHVCVLICVHVCVYACWRDRKEGSYTKGILN